MSVRRQLSRSMPIDGPAAVFSWHIRWSMTQLKRSGATTQPWRTPDAMENHSDKSFPTRTQLSLSEYRSSRRRHSFGGMPVMRMRSQRDIRSMLSKAALKSTNAMYNVRLCSLHFSIICRRAKIWSMVERPGMKPACCIRLRDLIAETDLRRRISARSFPGIDSRVIPRWFAQVRRSPLRFQNVYKYVRYNTANNVSNCGGDPVTQLSVNVYKNDQIIV